MSKRPSIDMSGADEKVSVTAGGMTVNKSPGGTKHFGINVDVNRSNWQNQHEADAVALALEAEQFMKSDGEDDPTMLEDEVSFG